MNNPTANLLKSKKLKNAALLGGTGLAVGTVVGGTANAVNVSNSLTPEEQESHRTRAQLFNDKTNEMLSTSNAPIVIVNKNNPNKPEKAFLKAGNSFVEYDKELRNKYSNPLLTVGLPVAGASAGIVAGLKGRFNYRYGRLVHF